MKINLLKILKYTTLSLVLSFSVNANSEFTYKQLQNASDTLTESLLNYNFNNNYNLINKVELLCNYEMPILKISENDLQLFGIENDNIKNMVHKINILKNDLKYELNNKIIPVLRNDDLEDNIRQALDNKKEIMQSILKGIESGNFTNNMYMQLIDFKLIHDNLDEIEKMFNMNQSFETILYKIQNEQDQQKKKEIIQSFYLHLFGNDYNNLDILMNYANQNILNNINNILEIQEVKDYIKSYNLDKLDININVSKEMFTLYDGFEIDYDKSLEENKDAFVRSYYQVLDKSVEGNTQDIKNLKNVIRENYNNHYDNVQKSIIEKLRNCYKGKKAVIKNKIQRAKNDSENVFKEVWDKQLKNQPLNKLLNKDFDLNTIQEKINKAENIDEKNQAIKTDFIDNVFGDESKDLYTVLSNNNDEDLEKVYNILNSEKVTNYMTSDVIKSQTINLTKEFYSNIMNNNGNQNNNLIEIYTDAILHQFDERNKKISKFIKKLNNNNINITNDFAQNIKNLLESYANKRLQIIEKETNELLNNPHQYFFNNLFNINK